jgi:hypothetical protein
MPAPIRRYAIHFSLSNNIPVRGIAWRSVRRVRTASEWAFYEGFDRTARRLFNHIAQGNTSDIVKLMMLRSIPVCRQFGARLLLQVHDELVFEVPDRVLSLFRRLGGGRPPRTLRSVAGSSKLPLCLLAEALDRPVAASRGPALGVRAPGRRLPARSATRTRVTPGRERVTISVPCQAGNTRRSTWCGWAPANAPS